MVGIQEVLIVLGGMGAVAVLQLLNTFFQHYLEDRRERNRFLVEKTRDDKRNRQPPFHTD
jgi:hypothetical protein